LTWADDRADRQIVAELAVGWQIDAEIWCYLALPFGGH